MSKWAGDKQCWKFVFEYVDERHLGRYASVDLVAKRALEEIYVERINLAICRAGTAGIVYNSMVMCYTCGMSYKTCHYCAMPISCRCWDYSWTCTECNKKICSRCYNTEVICVKCPKKMCRGCAIPRGVRQPDGSVVLPEWYCNDHRYIAAFDSSKSTPKAADIEVSKSNSTTNCEHEDDPGNPTFDCPRCYHESCVYCSATCIACGDKTYCNTCQQTLGGDPLGMCQTCQDGNAAL